MTTGVEQFVLCFLQNTSRTETSLQNNSQWLLLIHLNEIKRLGMVWEICFPNIWSRALTFFPHQNVLPLVTFHLKFQLRRLVRRDDNYNHQFFFGQAKKLKMSSLTQFLYNAKTHFLFTRLWLIFKLSQIWILPCNKN